MDGRRAAKDGENTDVSASPTPQSKWDDLVDVDFAGNVKNRLVPSVKEIYRDIKNPLTTESLKTIMSLYSEDSNNTIYNCLRKANAEDKNYTKNTEDEKKFRESLYGDWLKSLRRMSKEEVRKGIKRHGKVFFVMGRYALEHREAKTRQQLTKLIDLDQAFDSKQKDALIDLVESKCYDHASKVGWDFARNCQIKPRHRLYMNVPQNEIYRLAQLVKAGCDERGVKYDFKLEDQDARADSFMMYLTDEMLGPTIEVLKTIESSHPEIIEQLGKPPILSGKINGWLGYGSEPEDSGESFNGVRANIIQKVINKHILDYAKLHGHDMTRATYKNEALTLNQFIAIQETNAFMRILGGDYKRVERRNSLQGNVGKSIKEELGYGAEQMKVGSPLYNMLANFYAKRREVGEKDALEYLRRNGATALECPNQLFPSIKLNVGDKNSRIVKERQSVSSPRGDFGIGVENKIFRRIILSGMINDEREIESIKEDILKDCEKKGIDPETFCFDKYVLGEQ